MQKHWRSIEEYHRGPDPKQERLAEEKHKNAMLNVLDSKVVDAFIRYYEREVSETEAVDAENVIRMKWVS